MSSTEDKAAPPTPDIAPEDEKLKQTQEAALKALDEKATFYKKKKPAPGKKPPTTQKKKPPEEKTPAPPKEKNPTPVKEEAPAPEPEKPPEPREAPRTGEQEQIVFLKISELFPFKNHPFGIRDDEEMRAMVASVADKGVTQPAIVRPREDGNSISPPPQRAGTAFPCWCTTGPFT